MKYAFYLCAWLFAAMAFTPPPRAINGTVTDEANFPLKGIAVTIKGTGTRTFTDDQGKFSILLGEKQSVLVFSSYGFATKEVKLGKETQLTVRMVSTVSAEMLSAAKQRSVSVMTRDVAAAAPASGMYYDVNRFSRQPSAPPPFNKQMLEDRKYFFGREEWNRQGYDRIVENPFLRVTDNPLSTFSIDVDAASYANVRRILNEGRLPQDGAVRIEEMVNYFSYEYSQPTNNDPFAVHMELGACPWNPKHQLALIGLQGKKIDMTELPPSHLTFLIDVSGSMMSYEKLPLVKQSLKLLVDQLRPSDRVSLVAYAGNAGLVLEPTPGDYKVRIKEAIDRLEAGGSTAGGQGIQLAYKTARQYFLREGNNRVILCTDGDFNVGLSSDDALERMVEQERKSGVFLTVLGFGTGNYQDAKMQKLADKGNGNHAYIDQLSEAKKVLISEFGGTLFTIAKDVKLQVEFNPAKVSGYRLIGYENRMLAKEDFNNDQKDAGEMGSGHTVTALYEIVPVGVDMPVTGNVDSLRYQVPVKAMSTSQAKLADEVLNVKLRYKRPDGDKSSLLSFPLKANTTAKKLSDNFRFAAAVASFGMLLRHSEYRGNSDFYSVTALAKDGMGPDKEGYRKEFLELVEKAARISARDLSRKE